MAFSHGVVKRGYLFDKKGILVSGHCVVCVCVSFNGTARCVFVQPHTFIDSCDYSNGKVRVSRLSPWEQASYVWSLVWG